MPMLKKTKKLVILEGPDGAGKTTLAKKICQDLDAEYVHSGPLKVVKRGLPRMYIEAMLPAMLGLRNVVMDRCWLSEMPYGIAFRHGEDRLTKASVAMLERAALRCGGELIMCIPPWGHVSANYASHHEDEMLENENQLKLVYDIYLSTQARTCLNTTTYDYTNPDWQKFVPDNTPEHFKDIRTAGNLNANVVLVGESFASQKDDDPFYQLPFMSFTNNGCSSWLANGLIEAKISERNLLWVNADELDVWTAATLELSTRHLVALGAEAEAKLKVLGLKFTKMNHPQSWKRFRSSEQYPLFDYLKQVVNHGQ